MLGGLSLATTGWAAGQGQDGKDFPGIEALMSPEDYARAGLNKLTPAERQALDAWLVRYTAGDAEVVRETSKEVQEAASSTQIEARIVPPFTGWEGQTLFHMDNGQVWRQRIDGRFRYLGDDTAVIIKKNFFGFYVLTHTATGRSIGVELVP